MLTIKFCNAKPSVMVFHYYWFSTNEIRTKSFSINLVNIVANVDKTTYSC